jgi:hypothetical protein
MQLKRELLLIFILLITIGVLVHAVDFFSVSVEQADAAAFVLEDLRVKYPNSDIGILQTKEMLNSQGNKYYEVKARATQGLDTPCPRRIHIYYNYPVQNFVPQPAEVITQNCRVCTEGTCILNFAEEAIIASHTFEGTKDVSLFLVQASATPKAEDKGSLWQVSWDSNGSSFYYVVDLAKDGTLLNITKIEKTIN